MKKGYCVMIPFSGEIAIYVKAEDEDSAKQESFRKIDEEAELQIRWSEKVADDICECWFETCEKIVTGNWFHGVRNEFEVQLMDDSEDEVIEEES